MATDEKKNVQERRKYLRIMQASYLRADRAGRGLLLDTMETAAGLNRKTLTRLMQADLKRRPRQRQRGATYGRELDRALRVIAESYDYICAERLTPNLLALAEQLVRHGELHLSAPVRAQLGTISVATVKRHLAHLQQDEPRRARRPPRQASELARHIPMRRIPWDEGRPGHFEVDLVHHCGASAEGQYLHTLQMIDVATGWSERVAVLGRSYLVMADGFRRCQARLPFAVRELHPDHGSEFLNDLMIQFWHKQPQIPDLSRSRPYQKNDNRFVEQKNQSLVRVFWGDIRLDTVAQANRLNPLYDRMWLYYNFFQPVLRLAEKRITGTGAEQTIRRRFDRPQTPFERLCAAGVLAPKRQAALEQLRQQTNPRQLRQDIYDLLDQLIGLPTVGHGKTETVTKSLLPAGRWPDLLAWELAHPATPKPAGPTTRTPVTAQLLESIARRV